MIFHHLEMVFFRNFFNHGHENYLSSYGFLTGGEPRCPLCFSIGQAAIRPGASLSCLSGEEGPAAATWFDYIRKLKKGLRTEGTLRPVTFSSHSGAVPEVAFAAAEQDDTQLIVMGLTGAGCSQAAWGRSVTDMLATTTFPLLLVPPMAKFTFTQRLGFATTLSAEELPVIRSTASLARDFQASLTFWHIVAQTEQVPRARLREFLQTAKAATSYPKLSIRLIVAKHPLEGLYELMTPGRLQIIVMLHHQLSTPAAGGQFSFTGAVAQRTTIPVLVFAKGVKEIKETIF